MLCQNLAFILKTTTGGGLWHPEAQPIARMRRDIDRRAHRLKTALMSPGIRREFLGGIGKDEKKVVKAFVDNNSENALKTKPKASCYPTLHALLD